MERSCPTVFCYHIDDVILIMIDLTKGTPIKVILLFTLPLLLGNLFQLFYSFIDAIIVGHTLGKDAFAAVGATSALNF